jgi:SPP1 gp7 family putative phage head morphogenesis protein
MVFKPIKPSTYYDNKIAREIINWEWNWYYKPILDILKPNSVVNHSNALFDSIKSGALYYQNGAFYSKTGRFSNRIASELEKIGARYSRYGRCYRITQNKLPNNLLWVTETTNAKTYSDVLIIKKTLDASLGLINDAIKKLKLVDIAEDMIFDLEKRMLDNFKKNKIQTISPMLTDRTAKEFAENYTDNLKFYIKEWQPEEITKMREVVGQMAIKGESRLTIQQYIEKQFKVSQRKAKFLARNENSIAVTEYLKAKYQEEGSEEFIWHTNMDGRERELHKELNGKKFRYDNPPIIYIDKKKGIVQRGLPGETYNCRCGFTPVFNKNILQKRKIS